MCMQVGEAIVKDGATKLLEKEKMERNTAGKRLNMKSVRAGTQLERIAMGEAGARLLTGRGMAPRESMSGMGEDERDEGG